MRIFILEDDPYRIRFFREACIGLDATFAESYAEAVKKFDGPYDILCLDHDLGGEWMVRSDGPNTGYSFCKWLPESDGRTRAYVHSYNPDGAENMMRLLEQKQYTAIRLPFGPTILKVLSSLNETF